MRARTHTHMHAHTHTHTHPNTHTHTHTHIHTLTHTYTCTSMHTHTHTHTHTHMQTHTHTHTHSMHTHTHTHTHIHTLTWAHQSHLAPSNSKWLILSTTTPNWVCLLTHPPHASFSCLDLSCSSSPPVPHSRPLPIHLQSTKVRMMIVATPQGKWTQSALGYNYSGWSTILWTGQY